MTITTYDAATGISIEKEVSKELAAERTAELEAIKIAKAEAESKKEAILAKLGLTADEVSALLA